MLLTKCNKTYILKCKAGGDLPRTPRSVSLQNFLLILVKLFEKNNMADKLNLGNWLYLLFRQIQELVAMFLNIFHSSNKPVYAPDNVFLHQNKAVFEKKYVTVYCFVALYITHYILHTL